MALADITSKIIQDAEQEAARIVAEAEQKTLLIAADAEEARQKGLREIDDQCDEKIKQIDKKVKNLADHHRKAMILQSKREVLDDVFSRAVEEIAQTDPTKKEAIFAAMLTGIDADAGMIHPVKHDEQIVQKALQKSGKNFQIGSPISGKCGFVFRSKVFESDFRIESIISLELAKALEHTIFSTLFAQQK